MRDVAVLAEVSLATVSRVVNGNAWVSRDLAERVHHAIALLDYRPDLGARNLRRSDGVSESIGLVFDDVSNPFFASIHRAVEDCARRRGVLTFSGSSDHDHGRERQLVESFAARGVDGLIIAPAAGDHAYLERERTAGIAVVFVDRPPDGIAADTVLSDNLVAAYAATMHLLTGGHRRIGFLGDRSSLFTARERLEGYERALGQSGIDVERELIRTDLGSSELAKQAVSELVRRPSPPTAFVSAQNLITTGVLCALREHGLTERVAVVGIDDLPLGDVVEPGLTVVAQDPYALGARAAELLFARVDDRSARQWRRVVLDTRLVVRGSGEIRPST
jgi:LacI family transcriptional regulator